MNIKREFQIFAKPTGSLCNLHCGYCYYIQTKNLYPLNQSRIMPDGLLEEYIRQHIVATTEPTVFFSWHGGEPMLAGIPFFEKAVSYQKKHQPPGKSILNGIQTNGTLITNDWADFLMKEKFYVGLSLDGPEELHDQFRYDTKGTGSFRKVLNGYHILRERGHNPEILCVVNALNAKYPLEIYHFFKALGAGFMTFLPLVEKEPGSKGLVTQRSVVPEDFGLFLIRIFDEWIVNDIGKVQVQIFEEAIKTAFGTGHSLCVFKENCGGVPVVEHNGDFYSCDHFVDKVHFLGNISVHPIEYFLDSKQQKSFGMNKSLTLPGYCLRCEVKAMCNGECPKNRFIQTPDGEPGLNYLCKGYKMFFTHSLPFVEAIRDLTVNGYN
jgi:uncharacterized protein